MAESKWNGVRYDFGDETAGPYEGPESAPSTLPARPGSPVASDLQRRKRKALAASAGAPPASSTREYYDRQLAEQDQARQAGAARRGVTDLTARTSQAADRADATVQAGAAQMTLEQKRRESLQKILIQRVQDMLLPFQRAGLPPGGLPPIGGR
jgi:hypothetical protein